MNARFSKFIVLIVVTVLLALPFASTGAQEGPPQVGFRPDAPPYGVHGPYWVGATERVIDPDSERPIALTIWYPALNPEGLEETITYTDITFRYGRLPEELTAFVNGRALLDAEPDVSAGPYPLVIYSIGWAGFRQWAAYLCEHLASYGFVVMAPDHIETVNEAERWKFHMNRPQDVRRVIDLAEELTQREGEFAGLIDPANTGVVGWSYGGYTALAAGGARFDLNALASRCAELSATDPHQHLCTAVLGYEAQMAEMAGLDTVPDGLWPSFGDARVKAIIPQAGDSYVFGDLGLAELTIPMMAMTGSTDTGTPPDWGAYPAYEQVSSVQKSLVVFENGEHCIFACSCEDAPWWIEIGWYPACADNVWDKDRVHDLINHFTAAFLLATLKDDTEAAAALAPDAVQFPGVTYETTGF